MLWETKYAMPYLVIHIVPTSFDRAFEAKLFAKDVVLNYTVLPRFRAILNNIVDLLVREGRLVLFFWAAVALGNRISKCDELTNCQAYSVFLALQLVRGQTSATGVSLPCVWLVFQSPFHGQNRVEGVVVILVVNN
jgi:hypothetical protein